MIALTPLENIYYAFSLKVEQEQRLVQVHIMGNDSLRHDIHPVHILQFDVPVFTCIRYLEYYHQCQILLVGFFVSTALASTGKSNHT